MIAPTLVVLLMAVQTGAAQDAADLVVVNGRVLTLDARSSTAEAAAIREGVFVYVGSDVEARKRIGPSTRVIDAKGKSVIPGLGDLAVLSEDYLACDEARIRDIRVGVTVVGGKVVHEAK